MLHTKGLSHSHLNEWVFRNRGLVNVIKTGITGGLIYLLVFSFDIPYGLWVVVTIFVVMGPIPQLGGAINQGMNRIYGTIVGGLLGFLVFIVFGHRVVVDALFILLALIVLSLYTFPKSPQATIVAIITFVLVIGTPHGNIEVALWRSGNVALGGIIGLFSSYLFFPILASRDFHAYTLNILNELTELYAIQTRSTSFDQNEINTLLGNIVINIQTHRALVKDAIRESQMFKKNQEKLYLVIQYERRLLSVLELLFDSPLSKNQDVNINLQFQLIKHQQEAILSNCNAFISAFESRNMINIEPVDFHLDQVLKELKQQSSSDVFNTGLGPFAYVWLNYQFALQFKNLRLLLDHLFMKQQD